MRKPMIGSKHGSDGRLLRELLEFSPMATNCHERTQGSQRIGIEPPIDANRRLLKGFRLRRDNPPSSNFGATREGGFRPRTMQNMRKPMIGDRHGQVRDGRLYAKILQPMIGNSRPTRIFAN
jgi:hypothetical protein